MNPASARKALAALALAALVLVVVAVVVYLVLSGSDGERQLRSERPGERTSGETTGNALSELSPPVDAPEEGDTTEEQAPQNGTVPEQTAANPPVPAPEEPPRPSGDKDPPPEYAYSPDPLGRLAGAEDGAPENGATDDGAGGPGTTASAPALDYTGMELLAANFVSSAYGYTGEDPEEYYSGLDYSVVKSSYEQSPGGELLSKNRRLLADGARPGARQLRSELPGVRSAAKLESVEYVREVPWEELSDTVPAEGRAPAYEVVLRYTTGEGWSYEAGESELSGPTATYEQRVVMLEWTVASSGERAEGGWKLVRGELPTRVSS